MVYGLLSLPTFRALFRVAVPGSTKTSSRSRWRARTVRNVGSTCRPSEGLPICRFAAPCQLARHPGRCGHRRSLSGPKEML